MPFHKLAKHDIEIFHVLNPDPRDVATASEPAHLPSRPFKPDLPTLVLIHTSGSDVLHWSQQFNDPRLAENFNLFAVDCVFSGWTEVTPDAGKLTFEDSANFVVEVLDKMNFTAYHLLGEAVHGSNIAAWITVLRPEKVQSLTIAGPGYRAEDPEICGSLAEIRAALFVNKAGNGGDDSGTLPEEPLEDLCAYFVGAVRRLSSARSELRNRLQARFGTAQPVYEVESGFRLVMDREKIPDDKLAIIDVPVLILRGGDDNIVSPEKACEEWRRALPKAKVTSHTIASAPSLVTLSDANISNRIVSSFCLRSQ
ncbi:hypothetical protein JCM16303_000715 [Sporobolomyces ruberrimus]